MTRQDAQVFFDRRIDAWRARDIDAVVEGYTEDGVLESPIAGRATGRGAIEAVHRGFIMSFPDFTVEKQGLVIEDNCVVQLVTFSGTNTGGFMGVAATGKRFTFSAAFICTMRDGLVVHERRVYDFTGFLMEIGVLKAKPV